MNKEHFEVLSEQWTEQDRTAQLAAVGEAYLKWYNTSRGYARVDHNAAHEYIMRLAEEA